MSAQKVFLVCFNALLLNLVGSFVTHHFDMTIYLDTCGTIFIAALGGYVPGIAVGFFTNLITSIFEPQQMYFCTVNILVAAYAAYFARKGFFKSLGKVLMLILPLALVSSISAFMIYNLLNTTNFFQTVTKFHLNFLTNLVGEFLDKGLSLTVAFVLLKSIPKSTVAAFKLVGKRQAPLTDEMQQAIDRKNYLSSSLRTKTLTILMVSSLFVSFSLSFISYLLFRDAAISDRVKTVDSMVAVILNELNANHIDEYIKLGRSYEEYRDIEEKLYAIKNSNTRIQCIYIYRIEEDGCHVVFDLDSAIERADNPGQVVPLDYAAEPYRDDLLAGRPIPPIFSDDEYGKLLTMFKPLYDHNGKCQCYAVVDFSLEVLADHMRSFTIKLLALFTGCFIFIFVVGLWFIENNIILPVNSMAYCARNFAYDNPDARRKHFDRIKGLKISTGDEIENLYSALIRMTDNISLYLENLQIEKVRVENMKLQVFAMDELAHKDSLTGIKNKAAYNREIGWLNDRIAEGDAADFCIVMIDVNFLKRVNDTYGHERGNEYLINACRLACSVFGEEHVFRIGGDEFVVVVTGEKVSLCRYFVKQFRAEMTRKGANDLLEPWEKVSAAVGVAFYEPGVDKNAEDVFKRADKEMYDNKLAMKAQRTD